MKGKKMAGEGTWTGNPPTLWRLIVIVFMVVAAPLVTWALVEINEIPKLYPTKAELSATKQDVQNMVQRMEARLQSRCNRIEHNQSALSAKVDDGFQHTNDKLDKILLRGQ